MQMVFLIAEVKNADPLARSVFLKEEQKRIEEESAVPVIPEDRPLPLRLF